MSSNRYFSQVGGLPPQTQTLSSKAVFKTAYAVVPKTVMSDIGLASGKWRGFLELKGNRNAEAEEFYEGI